MTLKIIERMPTQGAEIFYDHGFRVVIETSLTYLKSHSKTLSFELDPVEVFKFYGQFYFLLTEMNYNPELHWIIMRLSGMHHPSEFDASITTIYVPDRGVLDNMRTQYKMTGIMDV